LKTLYFDCFSGASGDMILAALLDVGASEERVRQNLDGVDVNGWNLHVSGVQRGPLRSTRAEVVVEEEPAQRTYRDIVALLEGAGCESAVKDRAKTVFAALARAESRIHAVPIDEVVFHEVGSLDAIIDVVGCCAALEAFLPARVVTSPIATGVGTIDTSHGILPLPAPAVTEILQATGAGVVARGDQELITPTGAALLSVFTDEFDSMPAMKLERTGYGAGAAERDIPNVLRVCVGELIEDSGSHANEIPTNQALLIETNLDDMTPELVPYIIESLLEAGAHDAWVSPILMKKGRPAFTLSVLCDPMKKYHVMEIIFRETTTLGLRASPVERSVADRHWTEVNVEGATIRVKVGSRHGDVIDRSPEVEDVLAAARETGLPAKEIYARALFKAMDGSRSER
jgi:pyridinium-3,5-bisthiocarboxylic acid mononucleotide nickel chelatase